MSPDQRREAIELWLTLVREAAKRDRTWPNVTERDNAWRMWRLSLFVASIDSWVTHAALKRVLKSLGATSAIFVVPPCFPGLLPSSWLLEFSSFNVFNYSFIFFHIFSLLLSMMCSPSCRSLNFVPTCRPFSPVLFSVLYRMACSPVRLWALATICHYLPLFATILPLFASFFVSHSSRCVTTLFVPNACPSVSYCKSAWSIWQDATRLQASFRIFPLRVALLPECAPQILIPCCQDKRHCTLTFCFYSELYSKHFEFSVSSFTVCFGTPFSSL